MGKFKKQSVFKEMAEIQTEKRKSSQKVKTYSLSKAFISEKAFSVPQKILLFPKSSHFSSIYDPEKID